MEEKRIYLDESGICHKLNRTHGYSKRGERIHGLTYGKRKGRTNVIGAWSSEHGLFATQTYDHTVNREVFIAWLKEKLVPHLQVGMTVIMDNAPWHKGQDIRDIIEAKGASLIYLPPYSPDLNPIEHTWANLKTAIKSAKNIIENITENIATQIIKLRKSKSV